MEELVRGFCTQFCKHAVCGDDLLDPPKLVAECGHEPVTFLLDGCKSMVGDDPGASLGKCAQIDRVARAAKTAAQHTVIGRDRHVPSLDSKVLGE